MRIRTMVLSVLTTAALAATGAASAHAGGAWLLAPKDVYSELNYSRFKADDFHDIDGDRVALALGGIREQRSLTSTNEFGWKKNVSAIISVPLVSVTRISAHDEVDKTATGLGDMTAGLKWRLKGKGNDIVSFEADWMGPLGYESTVRLTQAQITAYDTTIAKGLSPGDSANFMRQVAGPHIGEGNQNLQGLLRVGLVFPGLRSYLDLAGGYRYRYDAPADQILLGANYGMWFGKQWLIVGTYTGMIASGSGETKADEYTEHRLGFRAVYRVDEHMDVFGGSQHTARGQNAYHRNEIFVGLALKQTSLNRLQGLLGGTRNP